MCRQFYRHCRDCHELFPMREPDMREPCELFQKAQSIKPHLKECPVEEIPVIRPPSGHGGKVCEPCSKKNHNEQRKRENAQKRARRAKLKRDRMTAGIGAGNVVWTPPNTWSASVVDTQTMALHSPQPRRLNASKARSTTQALEYGLNKSISTAKVAKNQVNVPQQGRGIYSRSSQLFAATVSNVLQPQENCHDTVAVEKRDDTELHHQHRGEPQDVPTTKLDVPLYQEEQPVGLGIDVTNGAKCGQSHTETSSISEWSFRVELNEWSTVFEDSDDSDDSKEL